MGRFSKRLDRVENQATKTMTDSQELMHALKGLVEEVENGVEITLVNTGEGTVLDFLLGKVKELPIQFKVKP